MSGMSPGGLLSTGTGDSEGTGDSVGLVGMGLSVVGTIVGPLEALDGEAVVAPFEHAASSNSPRTATRAVRRVEVTVLAPSVRVPTISTTPTVRGR